MTKLPVAKKEVNKETQLQTAWIGWLDPNRKDDLSTQKIDERIEKVNQERARVGDVRGPLAKVDDDAKLHAARHKVLMQCYDRCTVQIEFARDAFPDKTLKELESLSSALIQAMTKQLSVPANNEEANKAADILEKRLKTALDEIAPGMSTAAKKLAPILASAEFPKAVQNDPTIEDLVEEVEKSLTDGKMNVFEKLVKELATRVKEQAARNLAAEQKLEEVDTKKKDLEDNKLKVFCKKDNPKCTDAILEVIRQKWRGIEEAVAATVEDHNNGDEALRLIKELSDFVDKANTDNAKVQKESAFLGPYKFVVDNYENATKCENKFKADYEKVQEFHKKKDYSETAVKAVTKLKTDMEATLAEKAKEWQTVQETANPLIRFAERLIAGNASKYDVGLDIQEDIRTDDQKKQEKTGQDALAAYKEALKLASAKNYVDAIAKLTKLIDDLEDVKKEQATAIEQVMTALTPEEIERRETVFKSELGKRDKKGRVRFDNSAVELLTGSMTTTDDEGNYIVTKEYEDIIRVQQEALAAWHKLIEKGIDPVTAGEKAFVGIPYDMWPAEAIRAVAMFRRAEETFAAEREQKELEEELARNRDSLASKAFDKGIKGVEAILSSEAAEELQELASTTVEKAKESLILKETMSLLKKNPSLSKEDAAKQAEELVGKMDVGKTLEGFGQAASLLSIASSGYSLGKHAAELHFKRGEVDQIKEQVEAGTESPVKLRIAEYERNRLIWSVITDSADVILGAAGLFEDFIPGLGIVSNTKDLALAIKDATHFFRRLEQAASLKAGAQYDPETMMDIALAAEAKRAGLLGAKKTFDAAEKLIALLGDVASLAAEAGGISAPGGFALKAATKGVTMILHYGSKAFFAVYEWKKERTLRANLSAARTYPLDYAAVEYVFSHSNTYARFALAYGCLNSDPWARRYVLGRGLTEKEVDNPNTSVAILREYLNVTFQSHTGEAEEDEIPTTKEEREKAKQEKRAPKIDPTNPEYYGLWSPDGFAISATSWQRNLDGAQQDKLAVDKKLYAAIGKAIGEAETAWNDLVSKADTADDEYNKFSDLLKNKPQDKKAIDEAANAAKEALDKMVEAGSTARWRTDDFMTSLVSVRPLTVAEGPIRKKTQQDHIAMKGYLSELLSAGKSRQEEIAERLEETSFRYKSLQFKSTDKEKVAKETQEEISVMHEEMKRLEAQFKEDIDKRFKERWNTSKFKTPFSKKKQTIDETLDAALNEFQLKTKDLAGLKSKIEKALDDNRESVTIQCYGTVRGHYAEMLTDEKEANDNGRPVEKVVGKWQRKINSIVDEKCKQGILAFEGQITDILSDAYNAWAKAHDQSKVFSAKDSGKFDREIWRENKEAATKAGWQFKRTGVGPAMDEINETYARWQLVPFDPELQALYRVAHRKLEDAVRNLPVKTKQGFEVEGMAQYRKDLLGALSRRYTEFQNTVAKSNDDSTTGDAGWRLPDNTLKKWPLTAEGWLTLHALCKSHDWDSHDQGKGKRAFGRLETALADLPKDTKDPGYNEAKAEVVKQAKELQGHLRGWKIKGRRKEKKSPPFAGMVAFRDVTVSRLDKVDQVIADFQKGWK